MDVNDNGYDCPICEGSGVVPVLPIPRDPQAFEDRRCWGCDGVGQLTTENAVNMIDHVIEDPDRYTAEQAARIASLAATVIFGVRAVTA